MTVGDTPSNCGQILMPMETLPSFFFFSGEGDDGPGRGGLDMSVGVGAPGDDGAAEEEVDGPASIAESDEMLLCASPGCCC